MRAEKGAEKGDVLLYRAKENVPLSARIRINTPPQRVAESGKKAECPLFLPSISQTKTLTHELAVDGSQKWDPVPTGFPQQGVIWGAVPLIQRIVYVQQIAWDADGTNEPASDVAGEAEVDNEWTLTWTYQIGANAAIFKRVISP